MCRLLTWAHAGLLLSSQGLWLRHFWPSPYSAARILGFCLVVVWLVPLTVLLSLSANESVLPGGPGSVPVGSGSAGSQSEHACMQANHARRMSVSQGLLSHLLPGWLRI